MPHLEIDHENEPDASEPPMRQPRQKTDGSEGFLRKMLTSRYGYRGIESRDSWCNLKAAGTERFATDTRCHRPFGFVAVYLNTHTPQGICDTPIQSSEPMFSVGSQRLRRLLSPLRSLTYTRYRLPSPVFTQSSRIPSSASLFLSVSGTRPQRFQSLTIEGFSPRKAAICIIPVKPRTSPKRSITVVSCSSEHIQPPMYEYSNILF